MNDFLQRYKILIKTKTPVFIGGGDALTKKEYFFFKDKKEVWIPQRDRFFSDVMNRGLNREYEKFLLYGDDKEDLLSWARSVGYELSDISSLCGVKMECKEALANLKRPIGIQRFMRDSYGAPYIPSTSLKGAIRTAMLGSLITENDRYRSLSRDVKGVEITRRRKQFLREISRVEEKAFYTLNKNEKRAGDARNDVFSGLRISDSSLIKDEDMMLCQKIDKSIRGMEKSLNILRECIKPGVDVEFNFIIDKELFSWKIQDIVNMLNENYDYYVQNYVSLYGEPIETAREDAAYLFIGGGVGYRSKTISYELLGERDGLRWVSDYMSNMFPKHFHRRDLQLGVSPHTLKVTKYGQRSLQLGLCELRIEEV